jgi:methionyl-tRNA formyltransferase
MLRVIFRGTPDFSVPVLAELMAAGHEVVAVYSQPPRPAGRGMAETKSPVHRFAKASGLTVLTPTSLKSADTQAQFAAHAADVAVVVAYGLILPKAILDAPREGCLNIHASRLPRWRGAAPIQRAIMAGDTETAAMVMRMDVGLDTGPVCLSEMVAIPPHMTAGELHDQLSRSGADLAVRALAALERGSLVATEQSSDGITYAAKIDKAETQIDFSRSALEVHNHIRGLSPWPGAWFELDVVGKTERVKVLRASLAEGHGAPGELLNGAGLIACASGAVQLIELQRAGKKPMRIDEVIRGFPLPKGTHVQRSSADTKKAGSRPA